MNFLAHIYLSGPNEKLMVGNFMGDFIKGNQYLEYEKDFQLGILLHRSIDEFTDSHPVVNKSKDKLREKYRHYAGVIVDVFYDHFLAKNWVDYHNETLIQFTDKVYLTVNKYLSILPERAQYVFPYMKDGNWLYHYSRVEGINSALTGMSRRTKFDSKMNEASLDLQKHYDEFHDEFRLFFEDIRKHCSNWIEKEKA